MKKYTVYLLFAVVFLLPFASFAQAQQWIEEVSPEHAIELIMSQADVASSIHKINYDHLVLTAQQLHAMVEDSDRNIYVVMSFAGRAGYDSEAFKESLNSLEKSINGMLLIMDSNKKTLPADKLETWEAKIVELMKFTKRHGIDSFPNFTKDLDFLSKVLQDAEEDYKKEQKQKKKYPPSAPRIGSRPRNS